MNTAEVQRLQIIEQQAKNLQPIDIPVEGWLTGLGISGGMFLILGFALGWYFDGHRPF